LHEAAIEQLRTGRHHRFEIRRARGIRLASRRVNVAFDLGDAASELAGLRHVEQCEGVLVLLAIGEHPSEAQPRHHRELGIVALLHRETQLFGRAIGGRHDLLTRDQQCGLIRVGVLGVLAAQLREHGFRGLCVAAVGRRSDGGVQGCRVFALPVLVREILPVAVESQEADCHTADQEPAVFAPP
jgi:hypothetical protein